MKRAAAVVLAIALGCSSTPGGTLESKRPNIVLIFTDDQGMNDVGCYGSEIPTPHTDSLARDGLRFTSWYVASSICTPSRFGLLTGRNPSRSQDLLLGALMFLGPGDKSRGIHKGETTYAEMLRNHGYHTALIGKWHLGHGEKHFLPTRHGFETFIGHTGGCIDYFTMQYGNRPDWYQGEKRVPASGYATRLITDEVEKFLGRQKDAARPFYLHLAYNAPHFGKGWDEKKSTVVNIMQPHPDDLKRVGSVRDPLRREFAAMTVALDDGIGRVLQAIDDNGLRRDTLVIFMTDHGGDPRYGGSNTPFRGNKATLFEGGIRVPCLMRWPGRIAPGSVSDDVASALDLFPTFCRLAGADASPYLLDGKDLTPILTGAAGGERELFWELGSHAELKRGSWRALRRRNWKYVRIPAGEEFLFNLEADPYETTNQAEKQPRIFEEMRGRSLDLSRAYRRPAR